MSAYNLLLAVLSVLCVAFGVWREVCPAVAGPQRRKRDRAQTRVRYGSFAAFFVASALMLTYGALLGGGAVYFYQTAEVNDDAPPQAPRSFPHSNAEDPAQARVPAAWTVAVTASRDGIGARGVGSLDFAGDARRPRAVH